MVFVFLQNASPARGTSITSVFRHLGAFGLFFLAILDSCPVPTFGGPDILIAILAASHRNPWYEYAAVTTAGSVIGAYLTFRLARKAGSGYIESKFGKARVSALLKQFTKWGAGSLALSSAIPLPFPTTVFFAAAGVSKYRTDRFLAIVTVSRGVRYSALALAADLYGRHIVRVLRHPAQYWGWFALLAAVTVALILGAILINRRLATA